MMKRLILALSFLFLWAPVKVYGQNTEAESGQQEKKKKKKVISFEDQLVEGETKKPDLFYLLEKRQFNYKRLIKLRENFLPEMEATAEDLEAKKEEP